MKVTRYGSVSSGGSAKKAGSTGSVGATSSFSSILSAAEAEANAAISAAGEIAPTNPLTGIVGLQEISEEEIKRKQMIKKGNDMLDTLEALRQQLLIGTLPAHVLSDIMYRMSVEKQSITDPRLSDLIDEIELRAAVELAKIEQALANRDNN